MQRNCCFLNLKLCLGAVLFSSSLSTTTHPQLNKSKLIASKSELCASVEVSHNASYKIYDREPFSPGLDRIHSTPDIFEEFSSIQIMEGCGGIICELDLLNPEGRKRVCYNVKEGLHSFENISSLKNYASPDPRTKNYIVNTGCSCKEIAPGCANAKQQCQANSTFRQGECGKLFKEKNCSECRFDSVTLHENEEFVPNNGFWCQSYMIREGCRISIQNNGNDDGKQSPAPTTHYNYTGNSANAFFNYVMKPIPAKFRCICDVELEERETFPNTFTAPIYSTIIIAASIVGVLLISTAALVLKTCVAVRFEKRISKEEVAELVRKFRHGASNVEEEGARVIGAEEYVKYVSAGCLTAIQQPFHNQWEIDRKKILKGKLLDSGEFGLVHKGQLFKRESVAEKVALKIPKLSNASCLSSVLEEIKILAYVGAHENICRFIGACTEDIPQQDVLIILEYCEEGCLKNYLRKNKSCFLEDSPNSNPGNSEELHYVTLGTAEYTTIESLQWSSSNLSINSKIIKPDWFLQLLRWAEQIACGMEFLGSKQIVHIDLAARNCLLSSSLEVKICDFGLSQRVGEVANYVRLGQEYMLPFRWLALEALTELKFSTFSDIWSYSIVLFELFSMGEDPYPNYFRVSDLLEMLQGGRRLDKPIYASDDIYEMMLKCWREEPFSRPHFDQLKLFFKVKLSS